MLSLLIRGAEIHDGSGGQSAVGDVAVSDDRIVGVGPRIPEPAQTILDAQGLVVSPGFIDIHTHTDLSVFGRPLVESKVSQGVTLEVTGNCGIGLFPVEPRRRELISDYLRMHDCLLPPDGLTWRDFAAYADRLDTIGLGLNLAPLIAHGTLRIAAMGAEDRAPERAELARMRELLSAALRQGAWGMSTGLIYPPGSFADTTELVDLSRVLARHGAIYTSHIRGEGATLLQALDEAVRVGRESGARVEVSHLKALGSSNWGRGTDALARLEAARRDGVDIAADQYPYEATSTSLTALVPQWAHAGGVAELLKRLADPGIRGKLSDEIHRMLNERGGPTRVMVCRLGSEQNLPLSGKTITQIADAWGVVPEEAVVRLLREERGAVSAVFFALSHEDVARIMTTDWIAVGSDGRGMSAVQDAAEATHPRSYGTFPRVLGVYVREKGLLTLAQAIYKMTGLPASHLGLRDRGRIRPGFAADLTVFDPRTVIDRADFQNPHQYCAGIEHVFVNGRAVVCNGKLTGDAPGRVLRRDGTKS
jgi:N-acyl-D-amino-acid deacylase